MTYLQSIPVPILVLLSLAIVYPIFARGLLEWAHPKRLRIIELGRSLLHDGNISAAQKEHIWTILNLNGKTYPMWCFAIFAPFALVVSVFTREPEDPEVVGLLKDKRFREMLDLDFAAHAAGNPVAAIIVAIEFAILALTGIFFVLGIAGLRRALVRTLSLSNRDRHQDHSGAARA